MLVLARRVGERIYLDTPEGVRICVLVTEIDRGKVRLGFEAPRSVVITRAELLSQAKESPDAGA